TAATGRFSSTGSEAATSWSTTASSGRTSEDITPASGLLIFYSGSHRVPFFSGFTDCPQTSGRRTADGPRLPGLRRRHRAPVRAARVPGAKRARPFLAWHADPRGRRGREARYFAEASMVIHYAGSSPVRRRALTPAGPSRAPAAAPATRRPAARCATWPA